METKNVAVYCNISQYIYIYIYILQRVIIFFIKRSVLYCSNKYCLPACPACLPACPPCLPSLPCLPCLPCLPAWAPETQGNGGGFTNLLFQLKFVHCAIVIPFILHDLSFFCCISLNKVRNSPKKVSINSQPLILRHTNH